MSYVVIARRWRPQVFTEIIGQEHVSRTLANAIQSGRIAHSYIFAGPRGVGKTTSARILAKALNCEQGPTTTPCGVCASCQSITLGNALDVLEIDGASNRGIDEIRNLRENIRFTPTMGKYRIYIIDEVHMLTKEAFNALLKTLEEPPSHAIFIFATTEIHRVPATILSRCQRFDFKRMPIKTIIAHLRRICTEDKISIDDEALLQIAKKADGSMRDAQSILDQIISFGGDTITFETVAQSLGVLSYDLFFEASRLIEEQDIPGIISFSQKLFTEGIDLSDFLDGLEEHFRNFLLVLSTGKTELLDVPESHLSLYLEKAKSFTQNDLIAILQIVGEMIKDLRWNRHPHLKIELGLIKIARLPHVQSIENLIENIGLLKKKALNNSELSRPEPLSPPDPLFRLRECWPEIARQAGGQKASLNSALLEAEIRSLEKNELYIGFRRANNFLAESLKKNSALVENSIKAFSQLNLKINWVFDEITQQEAALLPQEAEAKDVVIRRIMENNPNFEKLLKEFDLELM